MRSRQLETALTEFVEESALRLQADLDAGAEVPFELASRSSRGRGAALYCYRPLTDSFVRERWVALRGLVSHAHALLALEGFEGLDRYLLARDALPERGGRWARARTPERADAALRALLGDVFAEQSDFSLREERLRGALERLDCSAHASATEVTLLATLHGLTIASPELALAAGLTIARPDALIDVPDGASAGWAGASSSASDGDGAGHLLVAFTTEGTDALAAVARGREVLGELLRALRLFGDGRIALGPLAWARVGSGAWGVQALGWGGRPHGMLVVSAEQEDELRAFCNLVSRRSPRESELAWALARFEMGCERATDLEALSDHLLALRALLEPEGPSSGLLAGRLAALCATPAERPALTKHTLRALALERAAVAGTAVEDARSVALTRELSYHLRALLRDVICGHLRPDLASLADELLAPEGDGHAPAESAVDQSREALAFGEHPRSDQQLALPAEAPSGKEDFSDAGEACEVLNVPV
ncbi:MAG: hypothetical protein ACRDLF_10350 [Solirubrobacteraceae bacterium]